MILWLLHGALWGPLRHHGCRPGLSGRTRPFLDNHKKAELSFDEPQKGPSRQCIRESA